MGQASDSMATLIDGLVPDACLWLDPQWLNMRGFFLALAVYMSHGPFDLYHHSVLNLFDCYTRMFLVKKPPCEQ